MKLALIDENKKVISEEDITEIFVDSLFWLKAYFYDVGANGEEMTKVIDNLINRMDNLVENLNK